MLSDSKSSNVPWSAHWFECVSMDRSGMIEIKHSISSKYFERNVGLSAPHLACWGMVSLRNKIGFSDLDICGAAWISDDREAAAIVTYVKFSYTQPTHSQVSDGTLCSLTLAGSSKKFKNYNFLFIIIHFTLGLVACKSTHLKPQEMRSRKKTLAHTHT